MSLLMKGGVGDMLKSVYDPENKVARVMTIKDLFGIVVSDDVRIDDTNSESTSSTTYVKKKELQIPANYSSSTFRIKLTLTSNSGTNGYARIYKNGVQHGNDHTCQFSENPKEISEDLVFAGGDLVQVYLKHPSGGANSISESNFRICGIDDIVAGILLTW